METPESAAPGILLPPDNLYLKLDCCKFWHVWSQGKLTLLNLPSDRRQALHQVTSKSMTRNFPSVQWLLVLWDQDMAASELAVPVFSLRLACHSHYTHTPMCLCLNVCNIVPISITDGWIDRWYRYNGNWHYVINMLFLPLGNILGCHE